MKDDRSVSDLTASPIHHQMVLCSKYCISKDAVKVPEKCHLAQSVKKFVCVRICEGKGHFQAAGVENMRGEIMG